MSAMETDRKVCPRPFQLYPRRRSHVHGSAHTGSGKDAPATPPHFGRCRTSSSRARERACGQQSPSAGRGALARARTVPSNFFPSSGDPAGRQAETEAPTYRRPLSCRSLHNVRELLRQEPPHDGNYTIVTAHRMEPQRKGADPEPRRCDKTSPQVTYHYASARHSIHLANDRLRGCRIEMMQDL